MMTARTTEQALAAITDEGLFERLATAILREADPSYASLTHPGVNVTGKTVKSPLDGICFVQDANQPHLVAVHHTITVRNDLKKKWLHDPSKVKPRKGRRPAAPAGDLLKTAEIVAEEKKRTPNLRATLVLTTNEEPGEALVRAVVAEGRAHGMTIDLWSRSRLSHFLDNQPKGQWLRRTYLGIEQEQLSAELLHELSKRSLEASRPLDDPATWVPRALDTVLTTSLNRDVTFLVAGSGMGKSVACHRKLSAHVEAGGCGVVLPQEVVAFAMTLDHAIATALRQLHHPLAANGPSALSLCSPEQPLLLVVEDINHSGQSQLLAEKLVSWSRVPRKEDSAALSSWRLICPLWPETLEVLSEQVRRRMDPLVVTAGGFSADEGRDAVLARARVTGHELSSLNAAAIAEALGHDPLLIALHDQGASPEPHRVVGRFVEGSLARISATAKDYPAEQYRQALRALAGEMLKNRHLELAWREFSRWKELQGWPLRLISSMAHQGELIRIAGSSSNQRLVFRHDRVREWLLADAAAELDRGGCLTDEILAEPYFAEVIGTVLAWERPLPGFLQRVASSNPLALFYALRLLGDMGGLHGEALVPTINHWLQEPSTREASNTHLRWAALATLAETDSNAVPEIVRNFPERTIDGMAALLRNGNLGGGIELCLHLEPGVTAPWRDIQIEHAKFRYGKRLSEALGRFLRRPNLDSPSRVGAVRLAGHVADPSLAAALEACWLTDEDRSTHLADYLWAFAECCEEDPSRYLKPVCDTWAALPDQSGEEGLPSPRDDLAADHVRWALHRWPPRAAVGYFVQRASQEDLRWPITYLLHGMDHPDAVLFVAHELAAIRRRLEGTDSSSFFLMRADDEWHRAQENGWPMSRLSRGVLLRTWQEESNDNHLRIMAFVLWAATQGPKDINVLRATDSTGDMADKILAARLVRGDEQAIPAMIEKLSTDARCYWWQHGRHLWSPSLSRALDEELRRRGTLSKQVWDERFELDMITSELIQRRPIDEAEQILLRHWSHLRFSAEFVQAALYVCTPRILEAARAAIAECPNPAMLLQFFGMHVGINTKGRPGLTRQAQMHALIPYLHLLSPMEIHNLWETCNRCGWFSFRREFLDDRLSDRYAVFKWDPARFVSKLDKMVAENRHIWMDSLIGDLLKADVSWAEIIATMARWLEERRSLQALRIVSTAILYKGTRDDLAALKTAESMSEEAARQLVADTWFALRREKPH